jgi:error-prone DNA polymerase
MIEWDKDDIEALRMLKIDILGLGMLSCIRKALCDANRRRLEEGQTALALYSIPAEDQAVYDMICAGDTVGVFQIESRAQMSMLPRLKPRCFYDLVIEVAIVRPGPIQGKMVHPYLRRRSGREAVSYPDLRAKEVLGKTLGVPLFQEQAMRLAISLAGFSPGEAEQLRRAMAAWRRNSEAVLKFRARIMEGMRQNGYSAEFAASCIEQLKGFSEYGFPESHAASFALLVYASAWLKKYYPAEFAAALLNSQPMGFYAPAQIVSDAKNHGVEVRPVDINHSRWDCTLERGAAAPAHPALRLGMRMVRGLSEAEARVLSSLAESRGPFASMRELWNESRRLPEKPQLSSLYALARADAFRSMQLERRAALWQIRALPREAGALDIIQAPPSETPAELPRLSRQQAMFEDYRATGLSLKAHPLAFIRERLNQMKVSRISDLRERRRMFAHAQAGIAGIALFRQRPHTSKGVVFVTLEDETGIANLIIRPDIFDRYQRQIIASSCLLARGKLEYVGTALYVNTDQIESLDALITPSHSSPQAAAWAPPQGG